MAKQPKAPPNSRAAKVFTALEGDDEFSVFSVDPESRKPKVELGPQGQRERRGHAAVPLGAPPVPQDLRRLATPADKREQVTGCAHE